MISRVWCVFGRHAYVVRVDHVGSIDLEYQRCRRCGASQFVGYKYGQEAAR